MIESRSTVHEFGRSLRGRTRNGRRRSSAPARTFSNGQTLDQVLKRNASSLTFLGVTLGVFLSRRFFAIPVAVALMLAQESLGMAGLDRAKRAVRG